MRVSLIPQEFNVIICIVYNDRLSTIKKILLLELDWLLLYCYYAVLLVVVIALPTIVGKYLLVL